MKKQFEEYKDTVYMIDKLELHLHLPEIRVEEDIPNILYTCSELTPGSCKIFCKLRKN